MGKCENCINAKRGNDKTESQIVKLDNVPTQNLTLVREVEKQKHHQPSLRTNSLEQSNKGGLGEGGHGIEFPTIFVNFSQKGPLPPKEGSYDTPKREQSRYSSVLIFAQQRRNGFFFKVARKHQLAKKFFSFGPTPKFKAFP